MVFLRLCIFQPFVLFGFGGWYGLLLLTDVFVCCLFFGWMCHFWKRRLSLHMVSTYKDITLAFWKLHSLLVSALKLKNLQRRGNSFNK